MLNQGRVILCAISTAAMDDLEGRHDVNQRVDQFIRLREVIEERASRKFFEEQAQADRPVVLRSIDFSSLTVSHISAPRRLCDWSVAAWTSRQAFDERADQPSTHGCD